MDKSNRTGATNDATRQAQNEIEKAINGTSEEAGERAGVFDLNELIDMLTGAIAPEINGTIVKALTPILEKQNQTVGALSAVLNQVNEQAEQIESLKKAIETANEGSELLKSIINGAQETEKQTTAAPQNSAQGVENLNKAILNKEVNLVEEETKPGELSVQMKKALPGMITQASNLRRQLERDIPGMSQVMTLANNGKPVTAEVYELLEKGIQAAQNELVQFTR